MEFKKLSEVEVVESVSDNAKILIEDGNEIKRMPSTGIKGASSIKVAVFRRDDYDDVAANYKDGLSTTLMESYTYSCSMKFDEIKNIILKGEEMLLGYYYYPGYGPILASELTTRTFYGMVGYGATYVPESIDVIEEYVTIEFPTGAFKITPSNEVIYYA